MTFSNNVFDIYLGVIVMSHVGRKEGTNPWILGVGKPTLDTF
jgi:hypothetical protein